MKWRVECHITLLYLSISMSLSQKIRLPNKVLTESGKEQELEREGGSLCGHFGPGTSAIPSSKRGKGGFGCSQRMP